MHQYIVCVVAILASTRDVQGGIYDQYEGHEFAQGGYVGLGAYGGDADVGNEVGVHGDEEVHDYHAPAKYHYDYAVHDLHTHDIKSKWETRDGDRVKGEYTVVEPDGSKRIVQYTADKHSGFNAIVKHEKPDY